MEKNETIRSYVNRFQILISEIDNMAEKDKIFYFTSGLHDDTRCWVQVLSPQTIQQATELAEKFQTFLFKPEQKSVNVLSTQRHNDKKSTFIDKNRNRKFISQLPNRYNKPKSTHQNYKKNNV